MKYISVLLIFFSIFCNSLFSMSKKNPEALNKIKIVNISDKPYRNIAVLPLDNLSKKEYFDYFGKTVQKYIFNNLKVIKHIYITTNDIQIPVNLSTNTNVQVVYNYGTNFTRNVLFLPVNYVNNRYSAFPYIDDNKKFADALNADYIISGNYMPLKDDRFETSVYVYNRIRDKKFKIFHGIIDKNSIEADSFKFTDKIFKFLNPDTGFLKIECKNSDYTVIIDNRFIDNVRKLIMLESGRHYVVVKNLNNDKFEKYIKIDKDKTNVLKFNNNFKKRDYFSVKINSSPTGAKVYMNVDYKGVTPVIVSNVEPGSYRLKLSVNSNTYSKKISVIKSTNIFINMLNIEPKDVVNRKCKFYKKAMYISLGIGAVSMLTSYYFYAQRDIYWDKYFATRDVNFLNKGNNASLVSFVSFLTGGAALGTSLYFFIKTLYCAEENIGMLERYNRKIYTWNFSLNKIWFSMRF